MAEPRLSIEISPAQHAALQRLLPRGVKTAIFLRLVDGVIEFVEKYGSLAIAAILADQVKVTKLAKLKVIMPKEDINGTVGSTSTINNPDDQRRTVRSGKDTQRKPSNE